VEVTYDDPETMTKPLTLSVGVNYAADGDMLEYVCLEDERDTKHLVGTAKVLAHPSTEVLAKYAGEYKFRDGVVSSRDFFGPNQTVSLVQGQLYMKDFPLIPQTETEFESTAGTIEFHVDSTGKVTHLILSAAEGDARFERVH
jgi:hypothetical protein